MSQYLTVLGKLAGSKIFICLSWGYECGKVYGDGSGLASGALDASDGSLQDKFGIGNLIVLAGVARRKA